jgi:PAS domain S-box-containing protein
MRRNHKTEITHSIQPVSYQKELIEPCYRVLLEASSSLVLLLSSRSLILEWNRAAERAFGWTAAEALGHNFVELCLPIEAHGSFLAILARAAEGKEVRGHEISLGARTGSRTKFSWNISRVLGTRGDLIGVMAVGTAIASPTRIDKELRLTHARAGSEARRVQKAVEEERRRIARELHDEFGQALTGLKFDLAWLGRKLVPSSAPVGNADLLNKVQAMAGSVGALLESVRATAAALRPAVLDDLGLVPALECLTTTFQIRTGIRCTLEVASALSSIELSPNTSAALFRIAQELLTNVMRHAAASHVSMRLHPRDGTVTLEVSDNGKGIARERMIQSDSFGLRGMQERASLLGGHFHIAGTPGIGTSARASMPVAECCPL